MHLPSTVGSLCILLAVACGSATGKDLFDHSGGGASTTGGTTSRGGAGSGASAGLVNAAGSGGAAGFSGGAASGGTSSGGAAARGGAAGATSTGGGSNCDSLRQSLETARVSAQSCALTAGADPCSARAVDECGCEVPLNAGNKDAVVVYPLRVEEYKAQCNPSCAMPCMNAQTARCAADPGQATAGHCTFSAGGAPSSAP
jgi:hypothetical protein